MLLATLRSLAANIRCGCTQQISRVQTVRSFLQATNSVARLRTKTVLAVKIADAMVTTPHLASAMASPMLVVVVFAACATGAANGISIMIVVVCL